MWTRYELYVGRPPFYTKSAHTYKTYSEGCFLTILVFQKHNLPNFDFRIIKNPFSLAVGSYFVSLKFLNNMFLNNS